MQSHNTSDTIDMLRVDIRYVVRHLDAVDNHIHWLGGDMDIRQVETPGVKAAQDILKRVDEGLLRLKEGR